MDGGSTNGCKHERYEGLELWMEGVEGFTNDLEMPVTCLALTSEALESSKSRLKLSLVKS